MSGLFYPLLRSGELNLKGEILVCIEKYKMKNSLLIAIILFVITIGIPFSCNDSQHKDDVVGDLHLRFKLVYGDQPLEMFKSYNYPVTGQKFYMTRLSFYISNITVRSAEGDFNLKDIDYLDLTGAHTSPVNTSGFEYKLKGVQARNYNSIDFSIGVPKSSNALMPKDFKSGHILSNTSEYWTAWKSYIFFRPEGVIALNGQIEPESSFALHLGSDEAFRSFSLSKPFTVSEGNVTYADITIDISKFFNGKTLYDIQNGPQIHSLEQVSLVKILADNLQTAIR